jgi:hypothetical protein
MELHSKSRLRYELDSRGSELGPVASVLLGFHMANGYIE